MVETSTAALAAAGLGGAYYLSTRGGGSGDDQNRPGRIPLPSPGGGGGGLSPGLVSALVSGGSGPGAGGIGGLGEQISGILGAQRQQFGSILRGQQAGIGRVLEQQQQLLDSIGNIGGGVPDNVLTEGDLTGLDIGGGGGGGGRSGTPEPMLSPTQNYRLQAAEKDIAPEARGANVLLEAARGTGDAADDALGAVTSAPDYVADVIGGDGPEAFGTDGGITGASYEAGQTTRAALEEINPF